MTKKKKARTLTAAETKRLTALPAKRRAALVKALGAHVTKLLAVIAADSDKINELAGFELLTAIRP